MAYLGLVLRWCALFLVGLGLQVQTQAVSQNPIVDSSYNFYFEQPCCNAPVSKTKYHTRHRRVVGISRAPEHRYGGCASVASFILKKLVAHSENSLKSFEC
ncbi:hypothetical protein EVAR_59525_1 [Eumeta japonica]|uniref:Uncharacterized protein n=1 Tax=Eumeta variegata TaxID=151549 RepID=A0A4C1XTJ6_EUMVA|nr:hypothetical protein EVAR_59525_1 [Eumeta japonica]